MRPSLKELLRAAERVRERMTPLQRLYADEIQRLDFVRGNLNASTNHGGVSMKRVRHAALELWLDDLRGGDFVRYEVAVAKLAHRLIAFGIGHPLGHRAWSMAQGNG